MKNSELAKQSYEFERFIRNVFRKCAPVLIGSLYDFDKYEFLNDKTIEITEYDYRCGGVLYYPYY